MSKIASERVGALYEFSDLITGELLGHQRFLRHGLLFSWLRLPPQVSATDSLSYRPTIRAGLLSLRSSEPPSRAGGFRRGRLRSREIGPSRLVQTRSCRRSTPTRKRLRPTGQRADPTFEKRRRLRGPQRATTAIRAGHATPVLTERRGGGSHRYQSGFEPLHESRDPGDGDLEILH